ncbi:MAG: hypothetical protein AABX89_06555 [Candidatus Thermoplasmatota archaeon]
MSFQLDTRHQFLLRRELKLLHLKPNETLLWAGVATLNRREGMLACTTLGVVWIRSRFWKSARRFWEHSLVERLEVQVNDLEGASLAMKARTARRPYHFNAERRDAKAFAAAVASCSPRDVAQGRQAVQERIARIEGMVRKGSMTEAEGRDAARGILGNEGR